MGAKVVSLTCDGPSCHFSMLSELGASLSITNIIPYFPHPTKSNEDIQVILDICHMLKLVRNILSQMGSLTDKNGKKKSWNYIVQLQKLQEIEGLNLATKLKKQHINWFNQKMKLNLAAQTLSSSVADAIEYCNKKLNMENFKGSEATVTFIKTFDHLFDILNSKNPLANNYKAPLRESNRCKWQSFLNRSLQYIQDLKLPTGTSILKSKRKTGFLGFVIAIKAFQNLFKHLVTSGKLKYILTYKFSQDHLELFFCALRACGGFNNNPTAQQFRAAYKRLFLRSGIKACGGNCEAKDETNMLDMLDNFAVANENINLTNSALIRKYDLIEKVPVKNEHDYTDAPNIVYLSEYKHAAIQYIAGYVAKSVTKQTLCIKCKKALFDKEKLRFCELQR